MYVYKEFEKHLLKFLGMQVPAISRMRNKFRLNPENSDPPWFVCVPRTVQLFQNVVQQRVRGKQKQKTLFQNLSLS